MPDEADDHRPTRLGWMRERSTMLIAVAGLLAWFAMLWFMFGDVL